MSNNKINEEKIINDVIEKIDEKKINNIIKYIISNESAEDYLKNILNHNIDILLKNMENEVYNLDKIQEDIANILTKILNECEIE